MNEVMVSIVCITYNHEKYIENALDGFLSQKTSFKFEIIIHDDASTDNTSEIIRKYEKKYPDIIYGIYQQENQYSKQTKSLFRYNIYPFCRGKYIALCEGDDFWLDIHKLQIQVNFLEQHLEYALVAHDAVCLNYYDHTVKAMRAYESDKEITAEEIIMQYNGNLPTASMVFRSDVIENKNLFWECGVGDLPLQFQCILKGKVYYFSRIMSVYRSSHEGSWEIECEKEKKSEKYFDHCIRMIDFFIKYNKYTRYIYDKYLISRIQFYVSNILYAFKKENEEEFFEKGRKIDIKSNYKYHMIVNELNRVYLETFDENYYDRSIELFVKKNKKIILFGAGDYASRIVKQLKRKGIIFEGFIVSQSNNKEKEYLSKPVWSFDNMPFKPNEVGIIVAIKPLIWNQLLDILQKNNITKFICPFLFHNILEE